MNLTKEQREKILSNFKRFVEDIKAYDILSSVKVYLDIRYTCANTRYDYISISRDKEVYALGYKLDKLIADIEDAKARGYFYQRDYNVVLDVMSNKDKIFAELEKENNKNKTILNDILNY